MFSTRCMVKKNELDDFHGLKITNMPRMKKKKTKEKTLKCYVTRIYKNDNFNRLFAGGEVSLFSTLSVVKSVVPRIPFLKRVTVISWHIPWFETKQKSPHEMHQDRGAGSIIIGGNGGLTRHRLTRFIPYRIERS